MVQRPIKNASTSARVGAPAEPPTRLHLMPATAAPKRMASTSLRPSASASAKPPWKASPAPSVSTYSMSNTGNWQSLRPSKNKTSFGPLLTARKASVLRAIRSSPAARSAAPVVARKHSEEKITWVAMRNSGSSSPVGRSPSRITGRLRRRADRFDESRIAVVGQHRVRGGDDLVGIGRHRRGDAFIAISHDGAVAARIHEDRRQRRRQSIDALAERTIDFLARKRSQHAIAVGVVAHGSAHRAGERSAAAEAGDRHRRIGRAAAVDHEKSRRLHLAVALRELLDAKYFVEHDDAGAEDARRGV